MVQVNARFGVGSVARRVTGALVRVAGGGLVLVLVLGRLGGGPFQAGLRAVSGTAVLATIGLTALATLASAWRWWAVASALGVPLSLPAAFGAYYRSQLLNSILPGGVAGDGHRAVTHGRRAGGVASALRAVAWERMVGQVVQAGMTAVALLTLPSPVRPIVPYVFAVAVAALLVIVAVRGRWAGRRRRAADDCRGRLAGLTRALATELRYGVLVGNVLPQLLITSTVVVAAHTTTLFIAARLVGVHAQTGELIVLLLLIQTATVIPFSMGGWGPREGMAAWAFAAAGMGAATGVTVTTLYAVLALMALAPGAFFLLRDAIQRLDHRHPVGRRLVAPDG